MPMASRNQRSWETATIVLGLCASALSSTSSVSKSRWLVGSSSSSRSASLATMAAIAARARWPGLRRSSGRRISSAPSPKWASSVRASPSSMPERVWLRNQGSSGPVAWKRWGSRRTVVAVSTVPACGASVPRSSCSSVVLPAPLGPVIATRSPPWSVRSTSLRIARGDAVEAGDAAALVGSGVELEADRGLVAGPLDPVGRRHLALEPVLARLRLLGDLLRVALELGGGRARDGALGVLRVAGGGGDVRLELAAALVVGGRRAPPGGRGGGPSRRGRRCSRPRTARGRRRARRSGSRRRRGSGGRGRRRAGRRRSPPGTARAIRGRRRRGGWSARRGGGRRGPGAASRPAARGPARRRRGGCSGRSVSRCSIPSRRRTSSARASAAQAPVASARSSAWA